ncbi:MAG: metal ABC transporter permease [Candidatus Fimadaptatus sp.]
MSMDFLTALPFEWCQYGFMRLALVAVVLIAPALALMGTMAVSGRMAFFSDALGHSALTGVGLGILMGLSDQLPAMLAFGVIWALLLIIVKQQGSASADTVISVFSSTTVALGLLIMAGGGGLARYEGMLVGDVLGVTESDIALLAGVLAVVAVVWLTLHNSMLLTSVNADWARSRGIGTRAVECAFAALMAVVVMLSIQWIGTLLINSMLILPAAAARNLARNSRQYALTAVGLSLVSGVTGLILSFYLNTSAGAAIVLCSAALYFVTLLLRTVTHR